MFVLWVTVLSRNVHNVCLWLLNCVYLLYDVVFTSRGSSEVCLCVSAASLYILPSLVNDPALSEVYQKHPAVVCLFVKDRARERFFFRRTCALDFWSESTKWGPLHIQIFLKYVMLMSLQKWRICSKKTPHCYHLLCLFLYEENWSLFGRFVCISHSSGVWLSEGRRGVGSVSIWPRLTLPSHSHGNWSGPRALQHYIDFLPANWLLHRRVAAGWLYYRKTDVSLG